MIEPPCRVETDAVAIGNGESLFLTVLARFVQILEAVVLPNHAATLSNKFAVAHSDAAPRLERSFGGLHHDYRVAA